MSIKKMKYQTPLMVERETILNYDAIDDNWYVSTNIPKHIRKFLPLLDKQKTIHEGVNAEGKITMIEGTLNKKSAHIVLGKKHEYSDQEKDQLRKRAEKYLSPYWQKNRD